MALSSEEKRILDDIEAHLAVEAPGLEQALTGTCPVRRSRTVKVARAVSRHCGVLLLCALLTVAAGVGLGTLGAGLRVRALAAMGIALLALAGAVLVGTALAGAIAAREGPDR